jgi:nucleotide-binding universal stress UspA family protein
MDKNMKLLPVGTILYPTDFSKSSSMVLQKAVELALRFDAELCLLYVIPELARPVAAAASAGANEEYELEVADIEETLQLSAQQKLHELMEKQVPRTVRARTMVAHGDAACEIARIAESESVDLIVIGTQGMTGQRNVELGSTAERVVRLSPRPVLSIRIPRDRYNGERALDRNEICSLPKCR